MKNFTQTHTIILRLWHESDEIGGRTWRGVVVTPESGEEVPFQGKAVLHERINRILATWNAANSLLEPRT
jgi:hypothetical protein